MGENSKIEWTDHTFNPWIGCTKVAPGCKNCYAEILMDTRYKKAHWGPNGTRVMTAPTNWARPLAWNRAAEKAGKRARVFCASLADVFEDWTGPIVTHDGLEVLQLGDVRAKLFELIDATPWLDWLLLTKRPENISRLWPQRKDVEFTPEAGSLNEYVLNHRENVWLGTSIATQADADQNVPHLVKCRELAPVRFLSAEPLLGPISLKPWLGIDPHSFDPEFHSDIQWVIVGGESGPQARPMHPDWARSLRDECEWAEVPFLFKQWGEWSHGSQGQFDKCAAVLTDGTTVFPDTYEGRQEADRKTGFRWSQLRPTAMAKVGKAAAGRELDGRTWDQFPAAAVLNGERVQ